MVATALACTTTIGVGIGLLPAATRKVATAAMEIAALARIAPGRLTVGGTPAEGARAIQDWTAAGTDTIVLVAGADEPVESYRRFAEEVFPLLGRPQAPAATSVG